MNPRFRLSEVHDVSDVAIAVLGGKGYRVWWEASERPSADDWWAEKEGREFVAKSPLGLLGLVALWEGRGDEWQKRPGEPDLFRQLTGGGKIYAAFAALLRSWAESFGPICVGRLSRHQHENLMKGNWQDEMYRMWKYGSRRRFGNGYRGWRGTWVSAG